MTIEELGSMYKDYEVISYLPDPTTELMYVRLKRKGNLPIDLDSEDIAQLESLKADYRNMKWVAKDGEGKITLFSEMPHLDSREEFFYNWSCERVKVDVDIKGLTFNNSPQNINTCLKLNKNKGNEVKGNTKQ